MRLFIGKEAEGPFRGDKTLFVSGDVPLPQINAEYEKLLLASNGVVPNIYFGSDNCSRVNWRTVQSVLDSHSGAEFTSVTVEVLGTDVSAISRNSLPLIGRIMLMVNGFNTELFKPKYVRYSDDILVKNTYHPAGQSSLYTMLFLSRILQGYVTKADDKLYKKDKTVWQP